MQRLIKVTTKHLTLLVQPHKIKVTKLNYASKNARWPSLMITYHMKVIRGNISRKRPQIDLTINDIHRKCRSMVAICRAHIKTVDYTNFYHVTENCVQTCSGTRQIKRGTKSKLAYISQVKLNNNATG